MKLFSGHEKDEVELRNDHKGRSETNGEKNKRPFQYYAAISANLFLMVCGTMFALIIPIMNKLQIEAPNDFLSLVIKSDFLYMRHYYSEDTINPLLREHSSGDFIVVTKNQYYYIIKLLAIGTIFGSLLAGLCLDLFGRKKALLFSACPYLLSSSFMFAENVVCFYVGRFIGGFSIGWSTAILPVYLSEIATPKGRGTMLAMGQIFFTFGFVYVYGFGSFAPFYVVNILCILISLLFLLTFSFMPESPYYLVKKGKIEAAIQSLKKLRGKNQDQISNELKNLQVEFESKPNSSKCCYCLFTTANRKAFFLIVGLIVLLKFGGIDFVRQNSFNLIFKKWDSLCFIIIALIISVVQFIASLPALFVIEYFGRRFSLLLSTFGTTVILVILGFFYFKKSFISENDTTNDLLKLLDISPDFDGVIEGLFSTYIFLYFFGIRPAIWTLIGEIFAPDVKAKCVPTVIAFAWTLEFILTVSDDVFPFELQFPFESRNYVLSWFFAVICGIGTLGVYFFVPETKEKTTENIQVELEGA